MAGRWNFYKIKNRRARQAIALATAPLFLTAFFFLIIAVAVIEASVAAWKAVSELCDREFLRDLWALYAFGGHDEE